jgi:ferrochelatase
VRFDALLVLSFGGPERAEDVLPFLQNVVRGRQVPAARLEKVAAQYMRLGGRSPINDHNRALVTALRQKTDLPVYWGNRNWKPYLAGTVAQMAAGGVRRAAVLVTSAYSSYSSCGQYLEDIAGSRRQVGPAAPELVKLRPFFDHPGFVGPLAEGLKAVAAGRPDAPVLMTAHSIPVAMAEVCDYQAQLAETARLVAEQAGIDPARCRLVYQSRSGPPGQPWLEPDILDALPPSSSEAPEVIVVPVGFVSDHMEVVHDLDLLAAEKAGERGVKLLRSPTPGGHPAFVEMVLDLMEEAETSRWPVPCRPGCCPVPPR